MHTTTEQSPAQKNIQMILMTHYEAIKTFCDQWKVAALAVFGSIVREDFRAESDIDILLTLKRPDHYTLNDLLQMEAELETLLGRKVDLILRHTVERDANYIRRRTILNSAQVIYAE